MFLPFCRIQGECPVLSAWSTGSAGRAAALPGRLAAARGRSAGAAGGARGGAEGGSAGARDVGTAKTQNAAGWNHGWWENGVYPPIIAQGSKVYGWKPRFQGSKVPICLKMGYTPQWNSHLNSRDNDQQNHWVFRGLAYFQTKPFDGLLSTKLWAWHVIGEEFLVHDFS